MLNSVDRTPLCRDVHLALAIMKNIDGKNPFELNGMLDMRIVFARLLAEDNANLKDERNLQPPTCKRISPELHRSCACHMADVLGCFNLHICVDTTPVQVADALLMVATLLGVTHLKHFEVLHKLVNRSSIDWRRKD